MNIILSYPRIEPVLLDAVRHAGLTASNKQVTVGTEFHAATPPYAQIVLSVEYGGQVTPVTRMAAVRVDITCETQPGVFNWQQAQRLFDSAEQALLSLDGRGNIIHIEHTSGPMRIADQERVSAYGLLTVHFSGISKE